ncbi:hypothetical protein EVAR_42812_1 [Eumeta japonica]|uniref:Uncharacterized protein n=1 Tax=Eumeta variegata TaxID=151549 RepID=A0A4C1WG51_EUMVA|nr:hypothetical protein EVAR_42812_1 [Eumeta japonica]
MQSYFVAGQKDKPFVSEEEMQLRTPRPDILSVPPNNNYYDGLREAESKFSVHPGNSIVGVADTITNDDANGLDSGKRPYRPPASWSTKKTIVDKQRSDTRIDEDQEINVGSDDNKGSATRLDRDSLTGAASQEPNPTFRTLPKKPVQRLVGTAALPNLDFVPPPVQRTSTAQNSRSEDSQNDVKINVQKSDSVVDFINRFDPDSVDVDAAVRTTSEIIDINEQLPTSSDISTEEERTPRKNNNIDGNFNILQDSKSKNFATNSRFNTVNLKPTLEFDSLQVKHDENRNHNDESKIKEPERVLLPPKINNSELPSTTMGPPVYYEWKWAVPAFDLEPPKQTNATRTIQNRSTTDGVSPPSNPFGQVTRATPKDVDVVPSNTEYNISSYIVPDFVFPLDESHSLYDKDDAQTSFQVKIAKPGQFSYGENPACPHCHPAYLTPGSCEPCIVKR